MTTSEPLTVVLAGCGDISRTWLDAALRFPGLRIVGLVDLKPDRVLAIQQQFRLEHAAIGTDLGAVIDRTHARIVFDCTTPEAHADITIAALERGCHVLGEKPMADSMQSAARMLQAARDAGAIYAVVQNRRYTKGINRFRRVIQSGEIGPLTTLHADFFIAPHFGGFRDELEHPLLLDMAIHTFDQARYISGADPVTVICHEWNPSGSWYKSSASAVAVFEMTGGIVFSYRGSWCAQGLRTSWESAWRAIGEKGTVLWDGADTCCAEVVVGRDGLLRKTAPLSISDDVQLEHLDHAGVIHEFLCCVRDGRVPQTACTDNIKSLAMIHAAVQSAASGRRVDIA
ncbi:MAG: Gfo/Idh/MocA family oxidoreductase [Phycisphaerales bacterium]|nr:Gfo/Idh/MocA family oxidoreductase [Phycisphaerales bacterium]